MNSLLNVENLNIFFNTSKGRVHAIRNLSFSIEAGQTLGIVGESGCGKSITNLALMNLLPDSAEVDASKIMFQDKNLQAFSKDQWQEIRGKNISMIFQDPMSALNPCFTIGRQLVETLQTHTSHDSQTCHKKAIELMDQVGIPAAKERFKCYPHELSGGMCQRIMIAMAIACGPKLLLADEPTTALDVTIQDQILRLLKEIQKETNMAMILVTHDLGVVAQNADFIQVMYAGEIIEKAQAASLLSNPHHPYTQGLLNSLPGHQKRSFRQRLPSITGIVPDLANRPRGCQFRPRCAYKTDKCLNEAIPLSTQSHIYRCHHPQNNQTLKQESQT